MARYCGIIGYAETKETDPGVWVDTITEKCYKGDILRNVRTLENPNKVNNDINISNKISIIADPYAMEHFAKIKYAVFGGVKWNVKDVEVSYPRLILSLGGLYNEQSGS